MMHDGERNRQTAEDPVHQRDDMDGGDGNGGSGGWIERREGPSTKLIVAGVLVLLLVVFLLQNTETTKIRFLFLDGTYPLWSLLLVGAALGFAAGWLVSAARGRRRLQRRAQDDR
ncbi:MAG: LapA family protein [Actinobacteria bacterium]|nr:MAG: LapA family protein [Actinomycetota bacterium]